jgi:hypothetical protein
VRFRTVLASEKPYFATKSTSFVRRLLDCATFCAGFALMADVITAEHYQLARIAGCRCSYERNSSGVPVWYPNEAGGIGRRLIKQCSRCHAIELFEAAHPVSA